LDITPTEIRALHPAAIVEAWEWIDKERVFTVDSQVASTLFRRARMRAKIDDLTFHDSRHDAITRLAQKLNVLQLARMVGHRDIRSLQTYYNETAESMARLL
jgi:integrase